MRSSISLELVPRGSNREDAIENVLRDADVASRYGPITHLNITDQEKFPLRSVDAVRALRRCFGNRFVYVPHIRASFPTVIPEDFPGDIALIVQGDKPKVGGVSTRTTAKYLRELKGKVPLVAGCDPYRGALKRELALVHKKIRAGAQGFFTQPFFSIEHLAYWNSLLPPELPVFYGVTPIISAKSLAYWKEQNHVVFPRGFSLALSWQGAFAREVLHWTTMHGRFVYLMPIRVPLKDYLNEVFR